jgi:hypothetical protein
VASGGPYEEGSEEHDGGAGSAHGVAGPISDDLAAGARSVVSVLVLFKPRAALAIPTTLFVNDDTDMHGPNQGGLRPTSYRIVQSPASRASLRAQTCGPRRQTFDGDATRTASDSIVRERDGTID